MNKKDNSGTEIQHRIYLHFAIDIHIAIDRKSIRVFFDHFSFEK